MARLDDTLQRLAKERDEADRLYNEALTALDKSVTGRLDVPDPAPGFDEERMTALNDAWNILPAPPPAGGVRGKLADLVWRVVATWRRRARRTRRRSTTWTRCGRTAGRWPSSRPG